MVISVLLISSALAVLLLYLGVRLKRPSRFLAFFSGGIAALASIMAWLQWFAGNE